MDSVLSYRGKEVSVEQVQFIRELIARSPGLTRRALSLQLCTAWSWVQPNGQPRDAVCRGLLLALSRAGQIELPAPRIRFTHAWVRKTPELPVQVEQSPIQMSLGELGPVQIRQVRRTAEEALFNGLVQQHHYLGYVQPVGEHLKFMVFAQGRPVACLSWSSAPRHLGPRDRYIGWPAEARKANLRYVAYNSRYLILPWVRVPHLASHLLGRLARMLPAEWEKVYGHPVYFLETFVHAERYRGTCYRAANWVCLGRTTGRGKNDRFHLGQNRPIKEVWGYALVKDFRQHLGRIER